MMSALGVRTERIPIAQQVALTASPWHQRSPSDTNANGGTMNVAGIALKTSTWLSIVLAMLGLASFAVGALESAGVTLFDQNGSRYQASVWFHGWSKWLAFPLLTYLASKDLDTIPSHVRERFQLRHLGWMGWLSMALFSASILSLIESFTWFHSFAHLTTFGVMPLIDFVIGILFNSMLYFWLGSLCLFVRFRSEAQKRMSVQRNSKTQ